MIVGFRKLWCRCRERDTWHEVTTAPSCVICHEYKWGYEDVQEVWEFIG